MGVFTLRAYQNLNHSGRLGWCPLYDYQVLNLDKTAGEPGGFVFVGGRMQPLEGVGRNIGEVVCMKIFAAVLAGVIGFSITMPAEAGRGGLLF